MDTEPPIRRVSGEPAALEASTRQGLIVLIDALRATTTIITALADGVSGVIPVSKVEECVGELTAGERMGKKLAGVDLDNSPRNFLSGAYRGKELTITTTNGTRCLEAAASDPGAIVLLAAMSNLSACARAVKKIASQTGKGVTIVSAGRLNEEAVEDNLVGSLLEQAILTGQPADSSAEAAAMREKTFIEGSSGQNLIGLGLLEDVVYCAKLDTTELVPVFSNGRCLPL
jgi:phosphosulfolactate phosphohydrolase-like enzyme